jgi:hypothetical protein
MYVTGNPIRGIRNDKSFRSAGEFPQLGRELRVGAFRTAPVLAGSDPAVVRAPGHHGYVKFVVLAEPLHREAELSGQPAR